MKKTALIRWGIIGIIGSVAVGVGLLGVNQYRSTQNELRRLQSALSATASSQIQAGATQTEIAALIAEIGTFVVLPDGETPTVATVSDPERLKTQEFFIRAQQGDKVLVYPTARIAVLYRPSAKKVLTVSTVSISSASSDITGSAGAMPTVQSTPAPRARNTFLLLNGTSIVGLTKQLEADLKSAYPTAVIVDKDNAKKKTYEKSLIVDMTGTNKTQAESIAKKLNLELAELPSAEATSGGQYEFLIIAGTDRK